MTNEQKYKTAEERAKAFKKFCENTQCSQCPHKGESRLVCPMYWLADEYKEPKPDLPFKIQLWKPDEYQVYIALGIDWAIQHFKVKCDAVSFCNKLNAAVLAWHERMNKKDGRCP